ncbi:MAG: hypothetical protein PHQ40_11155 [Anaerolineaceae bacterium]|nr:hypothetical protein [Anaerolineaceae bacterium]
MDTQNITLSIPKKVLNRFKEIAFHRQKSVSGLMVEMMEEAVSREEGYRVARERSFRRLELKTDLETHGQAIWKRDDLHVR